MTQVGDLFRNKRLHAGMSIKDVAVATGLKNINKQMRVLQNIESGREHLPRDVFLERFGRVLQIDRAEIIQAMAQDYAELDRPLAKPYLTIRAVPGFYLHRELPDGCSFEEACEIARDIVRKKRMQVALVLSRVRSIFFLKSGEAVEGNFAPAMRVGSYGKDALRLAKRAAGVPREPALRSTK